ncbi:MAG TPA: tetratricopeptide repeat protein [Caulobacteraceae bacterium]|nr:tetratricopeptide repeat protein [Caulobacteraceae bacterium]
MRIVVRLSLLLAISAVALPGFAGPYEDGKAAYDRKDYQTAYALLLPLAEQGNAMAQWQVGYMTLEGEGAPKDSAVAQVWWVKAADQGLAQAQCNLGQMFEFGWGGIAKDQATAFGWYLKAANLGHNTAQGQLARMYEEGRGVEKDLAQAYVWRFVYLHADSDSSSLAPLAQAMTSQQITEAQDNGVAFIQARAEQGDVQAQLDIGEILLKKNDLAASTAWFRKVADQGNQFGQISMGQAYEGGRGVPQDVVEAYKWYTLAFKNGEDYAGDSRSFLAKKMTPDQIAEGERRAAEWKQPN